MCSGYYHLELTLESQSKSAFVVGGPRGGKWEFERCPFGLTQAPAYFQLLVSKVIEGLPFAFGYLEDILAFSANIKEHLEHVRILFQRLREADLKLSKRKCCFLKAHVQYLGHYISGSGLEPVPEKLENLKRMPPPTDITGVRKFLGFVGYYQKFIPRYSDIARPLTNLTHKDEVFDWSGACQGAFEMLKEAFLKEPILKYPDPSKPYVLYTDASKYARAGVLTQSYQHKDEKGVKEIHHPITYISRLFRGPQINLVALVKEAYAIYMSTRKLDYYLDEVATTIRSDHLPLKRFLEHKTKNSKVDNWSLDIAHYNLQFEYVKGIKNTLVDTISRLVQLDPAIKQEPEPEGYQFGQPLKKELAEEVVATVQEGMDSENEPITLDPKVTWGVTPAELKEMQSEDKLCTRIMSQMTKQGEKALHPYYLEGGILKKYVYHAKQQFETTVVLRSLRGTLLKLSHDDLGHNGTARTYMLLRWNYYWKGMRPKVTRYVKQCKLCQTHNSASIGYVKGTFEVPKVPMDFISMDLIGKFNPPSSQGNKFTLTVICMLSGWTWCIPIVDKSAPVVLQAYLKNVHHLFGQSQKILSDNGSEFKNQLFKTVAQELGIEHKVYSPPFHPQSNGQIEGFDVFLKACLAKHVSQELEWDEVCPIATAAHNFLPNEHSRESPFFIMFGRDPRIPLTEILGPCIRYLGTDETILSLESLCKIYLIVAENL